MRARDVGGVSLRPLSPLRSVFTSVCVLPGFSWPAPTPVRRRRRAGPWGRRSKGRRRQDPVPEAPHRRGASSEPWTRLPWLRLVPNSLNWELWAGDPSVRVRADQSWRTTLVFNRSPKSILCSLLKKEKHPCHSGHGDESLISSLR